MEFLASDFKRKGREKKLYIFIYVAIPMPNLRSSVVGAGRLRGWSLGGSAPRWGCSAPKRCFLPREADSKAEGGLGVVKKPCKAPTSRAWGGGRKARQGREPPVGSGHGFCSLITFGAVSDASGKSPVNISPGWEGCPRAGPRGWVSWPGGGRAGV